MRRRVLIVDDDAALRRVLRKVLDAAGLDSTAVDSGEEAEALLEHEEFDLIFLDVVLPGQSGTKWYHLLSSRWPHLRERIVMMSGDLDEHREWLDANAIPALAKPFSIAEVGALVTQVIPRQRRPSNGEG